MKKNQIFKKTISFLTATALAFSLVADLPFGGVEMSITANAAASKLTDSKTGTSLQDLDGDNYYEISNANELIAFSNLINATERDMYGNLQSAYDSINGELTADIVMPTGTVWNPIGYYNTYDDFVKYMGKFDGQCHTISGLYVNDSNKRNVALFGAVTGSAEIKNIGVVNSTFIGKYYVGSICGEISDGVRIKNCYSTSEVSGQLYVGTIVGGSNNSMDISLFNSYGLNDGYTEEDFASGKIAYLLNEGKDANEPIWYQNIGSDGYPRYIGATVYCFDGEYGNHQHTFTYTVNGNTLTSSCSVSGCYKSGKTISIFTQGKSYDGNAVTTDVTNHLDSTDYVSEIVYKDNTGKTLNGAPAAPGTYTANLTIGGKTAQTSFEITKVEPVLTIIASETAAASNEVEITTTAKNPNNSRLNDLPKISLTYKIGENGAEIPFSNSLVIPGEAEVGTKIIITAKTAENDKYVSATKKHTITVIECQHENASTEWNKDEKGHWYDCICGGKVNYGEHQSGGAPTVDTPETCVVCDYVINTETGIGAFVVEGGRRGKDYTYENNTLKIKTDKPLTIRNKDPYTPTSDMIDVMGDTDANIIFAGVNIEASFGEYPLCLYDDGDYKKVKITLAEGTKNYFKGSYKGGIGKDGYTNSLEITGTGFLYASGTSAGIGIGSDGNSTSDITINGGCVTATSIRGYTTSHIFITGGSVKAAIGCVPKDENNNDLYLMEIDNPKGEDIIINQKDYPDQHGDENKIYVYLPAKTAENPNVVKVGDVIVKYYYDVTNSEWIRVIEAPKNDETLFIYDGVEKTYFIPESDFYTIEGNKQTNAGTYAVTLSLGDGLGWSDGSTEDKQYTFEIKPKTICVKADDASKKYGEEEPVFSYTISGNSLVDGDILTGELVRDKGEVVGTYDITQGTLTNQNNSNYDIIFEKGVFTITPEDISKATVVQSGKLTYNGEAQTPLFNVTLGDTTLTDEDYDITVVAQTNAGQYTAKIVGKGNYTGTISDVVWAIEKATSIANTPETELKLDSSISSLEKIDLPDGWMVEETDFEKELAYNKPVQIKVVYTGEDADSYVDSALTKTITVTRVCTHLTTEMREVKKATCDQEGYSGDFYCKTCDTKIKAGTKINKLAEHTWNDGVITKEATSAEKGKITYTCSVCNETKTEEIPPLGATTVGTKLMDDDENAWYKITDSDLKNGTVTYVSPVNKKAAKVAIPDTVEIDSVTYKVTAIGKNAFKNNSKIKNITIGKYVAVIEQKAFINCKKLKSVKLGKNVTTIGSKAFYKCVALTKFTIPSKTAKIGKQAFYGCSKLKTLTIRSSKLKTAKIGSKAFSKTPKKMTVKVPKKKMNAYKTMLCKRGINKKAKFKKN